MRYIFHATHVRNDYRTRAGEDRAQAQYETAYGEYRSLPQPKITEIETRVELYPEARRLTLSGRYTLINKTAAAIDAVHVVTNPEMRLGALELTREASTTSDPRLGYTILKMARPLPPGAATQLHFELEWRAHGFVERHSNTAILANGTFVDSMDYFPSIGYDPGRELSEPDKRARLSLPARIQTLPPPGDPVADATNPLSRDADRVRFDAVFGTSADQWALTCGQLVAQWTEGDRRYFHYRSEEPITHTLAFVSGRYTQVRDHWGDVAIEVYHHPDHAYNVANMIATAQAALTYCSREFGPYPHDHLRIVEFPRYRLFAQSLPGLIPYSEGAGFVADLEEDWDVNLVAFVTAHEVAHQWWGHQVVGSRTQGSALIVESLAQYSALMVLEKQYGGAAADRFREAERERYLKRRGRQRQAEEPLERVTDQMHVYYNKGSLVFYALEQYLGEDVLNRTLRRFLTENGTRPAPYTNAPELVAALRAAAPPRYAYLIEDLLQTITLQEHRATSATWQQKPDGSYQVRLELETAKFRADGDGRETEAALDDWIEVGIYAEDGQQLYLDRHHFTSSRSLLDIRVAGKPAKAGIDPRHLFIERDTSDNLVTVLPVAPPASTQVNGS